MNLLDQKYIHFVGIGGIGNSSLAQILHAQGKKISGSDNCPSTITKSLKLSGIKVDLEHKKSNISKKHQLVVYSPAIDNNNPELLRAKELKIPCLSYPQALGELSENYYTIAIAGTHGKSTTTAMISRILTQAGFDPTVVIGTKMREFKNRNFRVGKSPYLIVEACEYKESFLHFSPNILVITNVEADHLDYYKTFANYKKAFEKLAKKVSSEGAVIIDSDDKNSKFVTKNIKAQLITFSSKNSKQNFYREGEELFYQDYVEELNSKNDIHSLSIASKLPGNFNLLNASFAAITAILLNINHKSIEKGLKSFNGTWRRFEYKRKKLAPGKFIDDYAHHPTEIEQTLTAIREKYPKQKILCIFQPHQYSRTKILLKEFGKCFYNADEVIIPNIYKVRDSEQAVKSVSADDLVKEISRYHKKVKNGRGLKKTADFIKKNHQKYDLIITMGAGDIDRIYQMF